MAHVIENFIRPVPVFVCRMTPDDRPAQDLAEVSRGSGRGHVAGDPSPLYASEAEDTARLEFLSAHPYLAGAEVQLTWLAGHLAVIDLIGDQRAATSAGYTIDQLIADKWEDCQRYCRLAFSLGAQAVRLPSARDRPDGVNVIVAHGPAIDKLEVKSVEPRRM